MDCSEYQKHISMLIDGELGDHSSEALARHLAACRECSNAYARMTELNETLAAVGLHWQPAMLTARVRARLAEESGQPKARLFSLAWSRVPVYAMILLLAIGLGDLAGRSMTEILVGAPSSEANLQYLLTDAGQSFSDIVLDIAAEENSR